MPPSGRTSIRATTRDRVAVLAKQVADARSVTRTDARVVLADGMTDDE